MNIKIKRNYPILFMLVLTIAFLGFTLGNQPIVAYTTQVDSSTGQSAEIEPDLSLLLSNGQSLLSTEMP